MGQGQAITDIEKRKLSDAATLAFKNAYAPYSRFRVGSAVLTTLGNMVTGCNVENASYGLTLCAERNAIFGAVAQEGPSLRIRAIAVACEANVDCAPCGACRQVIWEFGPDCTILFKNGDKWVDRSAAGLLPDGFKLEKR